MEPVSRFEGLKVASVPDCAELWAEVGRGLQAPAQPWLPAAWLYDEAGCELFDRICEAPEYYPTRTERRLLSQVSAEIAALTGADELVEIGSGLARKTHHLLGALGAESRNVRYVPFDVSDTALLSASRRLIEEFAGLTVQAVQGDFTRDLDAIGGTARRRLVAFLGGTIGNFMLDEARTFVRGAARLLAPGDALLLAADLVKDTAVLNDAYNDAAGVTAAFNLNALARLVREVGAQITLEDFRHDAFFNVERQRIEMHARAVRSTRVKVASLGVDLALEKDSSISTEISRKFSTAELESLLTGAGLEIVRTWVAAPPYALCLARRAP